MLRGHIYVLSALGGLETQALGEPRGSRMSVASTHHSSQLLLLQSEVWEVRGHLSALGPTWALGTDLQLLAQDAWFSHLILLLPPFYYLGPGPVPATSYPTGTAGQSL